MVFTSRWISHFANYLVIDLFVYQTEQFVNTAITRRTNIEIAAMPGFAWFWGGGGQTGWSGQNQFRLEPIQGKTNPSGVAKNQCRLKPIHFEGPKPIQAKSKPNEIQSRWSGQNQSWLNPIQLELPKPIRAKSNACLIQSRRSGQNQSRPNPIQVQLPKPTQAKPNPC